MDNHARWAKDIEETQGHVVNYPMIGDTELKVAMAYDMLPEGAGTTSEATPIGPRPRRSEADHIDALTRELLGTTSI